MSLRDWAYWRPEAEEGDFYKWMASPPPGRERFVIGPITIDKVGDAIEVVCPEVGVFRLIRR